MNTLRYFLFDPDTRTGWKNWNPARGSWLARKCWPRSWCSPEPTTRIASRWTSITMTIKKTSSSSWTRQETTTGRVALNCWDATKRKGWTSNNPTKTNALFSFKTPKEPKTSQTKWSYSTWRSEEARQWVTKSAASKSPWPTTSEGGGSRRSSRWICAMYDPFK